MEAIKGSFIKSHPLEIVTNQQGKKIGMLFAYLSQLCISSRDGNWTLGIYTFQFV